MSSILPGFDKLSMVSRILRSRRQVPQQPEQQHGLDGQMMSRRFKGGNRISNSFGKKAWKHMSAEFYRKTSLRWDLEQLKSTYAVLRMALCYCKLTSLNEVNSVWMNPLNTL
ncbi:hypothetical protein NC652_019054 [Populus alba x Populus x berolinensis]|nr:hypothetical protein NC652_019054 [Populus alba x Populus x berolinensis]